VCEIFLSPDLCHLGSGIVSDNLASIRMAVECWRDPKLQLRQNFKVQETSCRPHREQGNAHIREIQLMDIAATGLSSRNSMYMCVAS
jgi:hypothetical protein